MTSSAPGRKGDAREVTAATVQTKQCSQRPLRGGPIGTLYRSWLGPYWRRDQTGVGVSHRQAKSSDRVRSGCVATLLLASADRGDAVAAIRTAHRCDDRAPHRRGGTRGVEQDERRRRRTRRRACVECTQFQMLLTSRYRHYLIGYGEASAVGTSRTQPCCRSRCGATGVFGPWL